MFAFFVALAALVALGMGLLGLRDQVKYKGYPPSRFGVNFSGWLAVFAYLGMILR